MPTLKITPDLDLYYEVSDFAGSERIRAGVEAQSAPLPSIAGMPSISPCAQRRIRSRFRQKLAIF